MFGGRACYNWGQLLVVFFYVSDHLEQFGEVLFCFDKINYFDETFCFLLFITTLQKIVKKIVILPVIWQFEVVNQEKHVRKANFVQLICIISPKAHTLGKLKT